jgi:hypothetical protein
MMILEMALILFLFHGALCIQRVPARSRARSRWSSR